ncbi:MAG TPA: tetratricopeptide repeat protein, partial [Anaeromyxobacteraceae bacterium]
LEIETPAVLEEDELALAAAGAPTEEIVEDEPAPLDRRAAAGARAEPRPPRVASPTPPAAPRPFTAPVLAVPPPPAAPRAAPAAKPAPPPLPAAGVDDEEDLDDEIEEADFLIQQGLFEDARDALENLLAFYPGHAKIEAKRAELRRRAAPPPATAPAAPAAPADESFDIARELADELGSAPAAPALDEEFQYSVEDVFDQFKKGVAQTVKAEDSDTHYDLGIAYKEMGLLDDALHEFEVALVGKGRKKEVDCLSMIALCKTEKGDTAGAVQAYQRALRSSQLTADSARAVHYELAGAYEATGDAPSALHFLHKVLQGDPAYRDAKKSLARLGGGRGRPPPGEEPARPPAEARQQGARVATPVPAEPKAAARTAPGAGPKKNIGYL